MAVLQSEVWRQSGLYSDRFDLFLERPEVILIIADGQLEELLPEGSDADGRVRVLVDIDADKQSLSFLLRGHVRMVTACNSSASNGSVPRLNPQYARVMSPKGD